MHLQVVASSHKLNLRRDLQRVVKRTRKFAHKCTKVTKKKHHKATGLVQCGQNVSL